MPTRTDLPELDDLLPTVDVVDVKTARGPVSLREFTAGALGHSPLWVKALFGVRMLVALVPGWRPQGFLTRVDCDRRR